MAGLSRLLEDRRAAGIIEQLKRVFRQADLTERERSLLDYAAKLTEQPGRLVEQDLEPMRRAGLGFPLEGHMLKQE